MKEEVEISNSVLFEFQRYIRGEMSKREEYTFQRKLQKDPFAEVAIEGFPEVTDVTAADDTDRFEAKEKSGKSRRIMYYSIAASVTVLVIASSAFFIVKRNIPFLKPGGQGPVYPVLNEVTDSNQIAEFVATESMSQMTIPDLAFLQQITNVIPDTTITEGIENLVTTEIADTLAVAVTTDTTGNVPSEQIASIPDSSGMQDLAGLIAEGAEMGSGTAEKTEAGESGYIAPQPASGDANFSKYIAENIRKPQTMPDGESAVAVVSFVVRATGSIDKINVLSSPGDEFSMEAIRLIKEGPSWKPAEINGQSIDDETSLRIVFK